MSDCIGIFCVNGSNYNDLMIAVIYSAAPLGLLFTLSQPYIRRIDVDGTNSVSLYSSGNPFAVDYDYRWKCRLSHCVSLITLILPQEQFSILV